MKKKGFTLVEVLAVILILGTILVIAIPKITDLIEGSKIDAYLNNEKMVLKAAETYMGTNFDKLPTTVGSTVELSLSTLQKEKYISPITDPNDSSVNCSGYVLVTKVTNGEYDYEPHLSYKENIANASADHLDAHYTFDDFQEPTTNLYNVPTNSRSLYIIDANGLLSYGTPKTINGQYAERIIKASGTPSGHASYRNCLSIPANTVVTVSYKVVLNSGSISSVGCHFGGGTFAKTPYKQAGKTYYFSHTSSVGSSTYCVGIGFVGTESADVYVYEPQIEAKTYNTIFTNNTRTGTVKDYSGNGKNVTLPASDTPRWTEASKLGTGAYQFSTNTKLTLPLTMNNTNYGLTDAKYTFSSWIYLNKHNSSGVGVILGMAYYNGFGTMISSDGSTYTSVMTYFRNATTQYGTSGLNLSLNRWYNVVSVLDKPAQKIRLYVDGNLISEANITTATFTYENYPFAINYQNQPGGNGPWVNIDGIIDDVRIYSRALSSDEIKLNYGIDQARE